MARRRSHRGPPPQSSRSYKPRGVAVSRPTPLSFKLGPVDPLGLALLEDRRSWHPSRPTRPFLTTGPRSSARLVVKSKPTALRNDISARVGFAVPKKVVVCVRRKQRKEVLHAMGKAGGRVSRRRRRTDASDIDCR